MVSKNWQATAFRTIVQTGGKDVKEESDDKQSKPNNEKVMKELGLKKHNPSR